MSVKRDIKDKVQRILANNFQVQLGVEDSYKIDWGPTYVQVQISEGMWNPSTDESDAYWVNVSAPLLFGLEGSNELFEYIATKGYKNVGGLAMTLWEVENENNAYHLWLESNILGNFLDEEELVNVVVLCGVIARNSEVDELAQKFGGLMPNPNWISD